MITKCLTFASFCVGVSGLGLGLGLGFGLCLTLWAFGFFGFGFAAVLLCTASRPVTVSASTSSNARGVRRFIKILPPRSSPVGASLPGSRNPTHACESRRRCPIL